MARNEPWLLPDDERVAALRVQPTGMCVWCGIRPATTREHKFKKTDLARMGQGDPQSMLKLSDRWLGLLRGIERGSEVQWPPSLCAHCNGAESAGMDAAYEELSAWAWSHQDLLASTKQVDLASIYGAVWQPRARGVARYLAKQLACMLHAGHLPVPASIPQFLSGHEHATDVTFRLQLDLSLIHI